MSTYCSFFRKSLNRRRFLATKTKSSWSATEVGIQFQRKMTNQRQERAPAGRVRTPPKMETTETLPSSICQTTKTFRCHLASHVIACHLCHRRYPQGLLLHHPLLRQKSNVSILTNESELPLRPCTKNMMTSLELSCNFSVQ